MDASFCYHCSVFKDAERDIFKAQVFGRSLLEIYKHCVSGPPVQSTMTGLI